MPFYSVKGALLQHGVIAVKNKISVNRYMITVYADCEIWAYFRAKMKLVISIARKRKLNSSPRTRTILIINKRNWQRSFFSNILCNFAVCMKKQQICILGSTGSIGTQALEVIAEHNDRFEAYCLTANNKVEMLAEQARRNMTLWWHCLRIVPT